MSNTEQQIEQEIQDKGLNAPRLTPDYIDSKIKATEYILPRDVCKRDNGVEIFDAPVALQTLTFCILTLENGFTVTGESACASPENFDPEIGKKIAYQNAREKIWLLEGYLLKEKLYQTAQQPKTHIERMLEEKEALDVKLNALKSFLAKVATNEAPMLTDDQVGNLEEQCEAMQSYSDVLGIRIEYDKEYLKAVGG